MLRYKINIYLSVLVIILTMQMGLATAQNNKEPDIFKIAQIGQNGEVSGEYRLSKYDVLNIVIIGLNEKIQQSSQKAYSGNGEQRELGLNDIIIGPDGYVNLPYVGAVKLSGLTTSEANKLLTEKLGEYIKIPSLTIMIKEYGPRKVYVMGEVKTPGIHSLSSDYMNVFAALSSAGGVTKKSRPKHIGVVRVLDGKVHMCEINFDAYVKKQDINQNIALEDGDMIYVPQSNKIDLQEDVMPIASAIGLFKNLTD